MLRNLMLRLSENPTLVHWLATLSNKTGLAKRFIAGETVQDAMQTVQELNDSGVSVTLDLLGEGVTVEEEARAAAKAYRNLLREIRASGVRSSISIKLTQLGLDISQELCADNLVMILEEARQLNNFVRIDMESSDYTQATIDIFKDAYSGFANRVGIVIQAYLYRSEQDVRELSSLGCNIRLCKGAYMEPPELAFPKKADVDKNFKKLLEIMLESPCYSAIATHDEKMIQHALDCIQKKSLRNSSYEFQMLYGIRRERQLELSAEGYKMRVYVPFGTQWAPYFMRRLAERPANLLFILKSLFEK